MSVTASHPLERSKHNIILTTPTLLEVLGHRLLNLSIDYISPVLLQSLPWLPAAVPQVLLSWGLAAPEEVYLQLTLPYIL